MRSTQTTALNSAYKVHRSRIHTAGKGYASAIASGINTLGLVDVFAATLPTLKFSPGVHVNYAETVLPMRDGLPKFKDFPAEFGGSGEQIAE
jgi:hypothetical protein